MNWIKYLSKVRLGREMEIPPQFDGRNEFQKDFDRIVFSGAFRRLQNKTQVIPLPETDFVHTRLTHSIESSCVGRSVGHLAGMKIIGQKLGNTEGLSPYDFEAVVAAACLAHDIGNPPFGHAGEAAISEFFRAHGNAHLLEGLTEGEMEDLKNFEGNAAGFRILTHSYPKLSERSGGIGLTYATLSIYTKYPKQSLPDLSSSGKASEKKYGILQADKENFIKIADVIGLKQKEHFPGGYLRHPLSFLVEAADDITYKIVDFEDGYKLKLVPFETIKKLFMEIASSKGATGLTNLTRIKGNEEQIGYLRANAINSLINQAVDIFIENLEAILNGEFDKNLLSQTFSSDVLKEIQAISVDDIYRSRPVVEIETAGFEIIYGLLEAYLNAALVNNTGRHQRIKMLLPDYLIDEDMLKQGFRYSTILNIVLYVSGMTDNLAIDTYRKIKGISLPRL